MVFLSYKFLLCRMYFAGENAAEALENIKEAIELYLESLKAHDEPIPPSIEDEILEVNV